MAVIWERRSAGTCYQVRRVGNSMRLYTNGVFHSQYNPRRRGAANVWDLLTLPVFLFPPQRSLNVLLLGVGGGAVIRQLQSWRGNCRVTGIELDRVHVQIAQRFFGIDSAQATLVEDDAVRWVRRHRKAAYDLIIDDLFGHAEGEPQRAVAVTRRWVGDLQRLLKPDGLLVVNCVDRRELQGSALCACDELRQAFPLRFQLSLPGYENRIGGFARAGVFPSPARALQPQRGRLSFRLGTL